MYPTIQFSQTNTLYCMYQSLFCEEYLLEIFITNAKTINSFFSIYFRRFFKDMPHVALDKKSNMEYIEKEIGLKRFLPTTVIRSMKVLEYG